MSLNYVIRFFGVIRMDRNIRLYDEPSRAKKVVIEGIVLLVILVIAAGLAFLLVHFCTDQIKMPGKSMQETLEEGDLLLINTVAYKLGNPRRGDVIVYQAEDTGAFSVKRVVGLPGDTVQIKEGKLYVNNTEYAETTKVDLMQSSGLASEAIVIPEEMYFVLGDNRNNSEDSRFASVGNIKRSQILGKAYLRLSPKFNFIDKLGLEGKNGD